MDIFLSLGGMFGLAAHAEQNDSTDRWMKIAAEITNTCHESYVRSATKLGPEAFIFNDKNEAVAANSGSR